MGKNFFPFLRCGLFYILRRKVFSVASFVKKILGNCFSFFFPLSRNLATDGWSHHLFPVYKRGKIFKMFAKRKSLSRLRAAAVQKTDVELFAKLFNLLPRKERNPLFPAPPPRRCVNNRWSNSKIKLHLPLTTYGFPSKRLLNELVPCKDPICPLPPSPPFPFVATRRP